MAFGIIYFLQKFLSGEYDVVQPSFISLVTKQSGVFKIGANYCRGEKRATFNSFIRLQDYPQPDLNINYTKTIVTRGLDKSEESAARLQNKRL